MRSSCSGGGVDNGVQKGEHGVQGGETLAGYEVQGVGCREVTETLGRHEVQGVGCREVRRWL